MDIFGEWDSRRHVHAITLTTTSTMVIVPLIAPKTVAKIVAQSTSPSL